MRAGPLALALALALGGCVKQTCTTAEDCAGDDVCLDGLCSAPECATADDCAEGEQCFNHVCTGADGTCETVDAPGFCAEDLNPASDTYGHEVCVGDAGGTPGLLFFGTITCGTCQALARSLEAHRDALGKTAGAAPFGAFVQTSAYVTSPSEVEEVFGSGMGLAFVQDDASLGIWESWGASQYDAAVVDADGCLVAYFSHLTTTQLDGDVGERLDEAWASATAE